MSNFAEVQKTGEEATKPEVMSIAEQRTRRADMDKGFDEISKVVGGLARLLPKDISSGLGAMFGGNEKGAILEAQEKSFDLVSYNLESMIGDLKTQSPLTREGLSQGLEDFAKHSNIKDKASFLEDVFLYLDAQDLSALDFDKFAKEVWEMDAVQDASKNAIDPIADLFHKHKESENIGYGMRVKFTKDDIDQLQFKDGELATKFLSSRGDFKDPGTSISKDEIFEILESDEVYAQLVYGPAEEDGNRPAVGMYISSEQNENSSMIGTKGFYIDTTQELDYAAIPENIRDRFKDMEGGVALDVKPEVALETDPNLQAAIQEGQKTAFANVETQPGIDPKVGLN